MSRNTFFLAACLGGLILSSPVFAQDAQPSLGDIARQARKDKENSASKPKMVVTDDSFPGRKTGTSALSGIDLPGAAAQSSASGKQDPLAEAMGKFNEADANFNQLGALDRAALAKVALAEDCNVQFPSRASWEDKLYAAKEQYVTHMRQITAEMKQMTTEAMSWKGPDGKLDPNDPRVQALRRKTESTMQDATETQHRFESVIDEGVALAKAAKR